MLQEVIAQRANEKGTCTCVGLVWCADGMIVCVSDAVDSGDCGGW